LPGTLGGGIYLSTNNGTNWVAVNTGITNHKVVSLSVSDTYLLAGTSQGCVYRRLLSEMIIPVELISFNASLIDIKVILNWSTATETNNQGFEILRFAQIDKEWEMVGFVPGHGTTTETQHYLFTDNDVKPGKYQYKLKQIDYDGTFEYSQIVEVKIPFSNKFSLSQNYPNPFNPVTKMKYTIPQTVNPLQVGARGGLVTLKVYDIIGNEVVTLVNEEKPAGEYEVEFNGITLPSGIYFYQLKVGTFVETKKMILLK
jgi:hypothetical protein